MEKCKKVGEGGGEISRGLDGEQIGMRLGCAQSRGVKL